MKKLEKHAIKSDLPFPIVGIGASAGGLAAFEAFFSAMPADQDPNMAFVLVQHLAPDHKSILTDLIRRYTRMQVFEVEDGMVVKPNCTYIIPPNRDMAFLNGSLQLLELSSPRSQRLPIDFFFRSLAADQHEKAICIVLSGTGSDGTLGIRAIKGEGGMVMVQNPASTEFDGMPRSALSTGLVDYELPPAEMPAQLIAYATHAFGKLPKVMTITELKEENMYQKIFILLRSQTGSDFSQYKPSTINRRIERRMAVNQIETLPEYLKFLQQTPVEVEALFHDLLIGVTNFFRDPAVFQYLEEHLIPKLFAAKSSNDVLRIWVPGCSTGEEAYSIAILLAEQLERIKKEITIQIFGTDIDSTAIATARAGLYPSSIAVDITPERLQRYFTSKSSPTDATPSAYQIHKNIRDMLVFSEQNLIKDPPFSKVDMISCRNLLIYFGIDLQKKLIPLFHYSLNPEGVLLLGTSETVGDFSNLFTLLDRKSKLFLRKEDLGSPRPLLNHIFPVKTAHDITSSKILPEKTLPRKLPLREVTEQALLSQIAPAGALITAQGDILYLHGRSGMYLEPTQGETAVNNILKMAREGLTRDLTVALHKAIRTKEKVHHQGLRVKTNGDFTTVNLTIIPVEEELISVSRSPLYLVVLEQAVLSENSGKEIRMDTNETIVSLKKELRAKEEYLQTANEELESSNEELRSSNEEMQSVNEELQSTNEELETSKEELQSVNEELATVNAELQTKVADLSRVNNDMNNLLAGTGIGTIFVDCNLKILRFTPPTSKIINLILSDLGRPLGHIMSNLVGYDHMMKDVQEVLDTLIPQEVEVQTKDNKFYTMRIQPYRTLDNVIEGAVITFVDITEMKETRETLRKANDILRLAVVVRDAWDAITVQDLEGQIIAWNQGAVRMYGWSEEEALAMNVRDRIPQDLRDEASAQVIKLSKAKMLEPYLTHRLAKDGTDVEVSIISTSLVDETGKIYAVATTERLKK
jgi:two-component system, chemotaxis family, CheB/CheR fusion protein